MPWVRTDVFIGGTPLQVDQKKLKNPEKAPHIMIGTPGRFLQLANQKLINFDNNQVFVLDECDKLIDETSMREQVQKIFVQGTSERQVMMFSATFPDKTK